MQREVPTNEDHKLQRLKMYINQFDSKYLSIEYGKLPFVIRLFFSGFVIESLISSMK